MAARMFGGRPAAIDAGLRGIEWLNAWV